MWRDYHLWDQRHCKRSDSTAYPSRFADLLQISEYIKTGYVRETLDIQQSPYYQSLVSFNSVYGIGPTTARHLYQIGLRTLEDLKGHYERRSARNLNDTFSEGMVNSILLRKDIAKKSVIGSCLPSSSNMKQDCP